MLRNILSYFTLIIVIFFSLIFIIDQNRKYQKLESLQSQISKQIYTKITSYKENLYEIEKRKIINHKKNPKNELNVLYIDQEK